MTTSTTGLAVTSKISLLSFLMLLFKPTITIDGQAHTGAWSRVEVPCAAGTHTVDVSWKYLGFLECNKGTMTATVVDGAMTEVTYQARWFFLSPGKMSLGQSVAAVA